MTVTFVNETKCYCAVIWINFENTAIYVDLDSREPYRRTANVTHPWIFGSSQVSWKGIRILEKALHASESRGAAFETEEHAQAAYSRMAQFGDETVCLQDNKTEKSLKIGGWRLRIRPICRNWRNGSGSTLTDETNPR